MKTFICERTWGITECLVANSSPPASIPRFFWLSAASFVKIFACRAVMSQFLELFLLSVCNFIDCNFACKLFIVLTCSVQIDVSSCDLVSQLWKCRSSFAKFLLQLTRCRNLFLGWHLYELVVTDNNKLFLASYVFSFLKASWVAIFSPCRLQTLLWFHF